MNSTNKIKNKILPIIIAVSIISAYFLYNTATSSAAINDCLSISENLIQNCSFENPATLPVGYTNHSTGHVVFPAGYTGLSGWNVIAPVKASNVGYFLPGFPAPSGTKILDLSGFVDMYNLGMNGEQAGSGVEQTVSGLAIGQTYTLTFSQGYLAPFASEIAVSINGINQGVFDLDAKTAGSTNILGVLWKDQTITFTATSSSATIRFIHTIAQPGGKVVIYGSALDNVRLVAVSRRSDTVVTTPVTNVVVPSVITENPIKEQIDHPIKPTIQPIVQTTNSQSTTISEINIRSNYQNPFYASINNVITLNYTLKNIPQTNKVIMGGQSVDPVCFGTAPIYQCSAAIIVTNDIPMEDGLVQFTISTTMESRRSNATATTDGSYVIVKRIGKLPTEITDHPPTTEPVTNTPSVLTGSCSSDRDVIINGTGFTPRSGVVTCINGTFTFPVIVTGDPVFTATPSEVIHHTVVGGTKNPPKEDVAPVVTTDTTTTTFTSPIINPITTTSSPAGTVENTGVPNSVWGTPETANGLPNKCIPYFTQYLIKGDRDGSKGITEVNKIQKFLNQYLGISIPIDGAFDSLTDSAVKSFQGKYVPNIIIPWEISGPTGWWYQSTRSYANYLTGCSEGVVRLDNGVRILDGQIID